MKLGMMTAYAQSKKVPSAKEAVMVSGLLFMLGGLGIVLGAFVEWAVYALVFTLVIVSLKMHNFWEISDPQQKMVEMVNFMKNMAFIGAVLMFLSLSQPWPFSIL